MRALPGCEPGPEPSLAERQGHSGKAGTRHGRPALWAKGGPGADEETVRGIYLSLYGRLPEAAEVSIAMQHLGRAVELPAEKQATARRHAYEDILWALLNTKEFLFNH